MSLSVNESTRPRIFVLHENAPWVEPLRREFAAIDAPFSEWFLDRGLVDLTSAPPEGIFYNRMSASSHTRGHRYAPEYTAAVLAWLTKHGRTIVNGERALQLEISKVAQYESLARFGIETPATIAAIGREHIPKAASAIGYPVILKHNRAGKGLGVKLIYSEAALQEHLASDAFEDSVDGIMLVQRYIKAPEPFITRVEFVGGKLLYAVRVDTSQGFELCPADACQIEDARRGLSCRRSRRQVSDRPALRARAHPGLAILPGRERHRRCRHRVHRGRARPPLHLRRQHEHQLQSRCRGQGRPPWHAGNCLASQEPSHPAIRSSKPARLGRLNSSSTL